MFKTKSKSPKFVIKSSILLGTDKEIATEMYKKKKKNTRNDRNWKEIKQKLSEEKNWQRATKRVHKAYRCIQLYLKLDSIIPKIPFNF